MSCPSYPGCAQAPTELPSIVGTAPREEAYCVVELPKPWPAKVKKVEGLIQELRDALKARKGEEAKLLATPEIPSTIFSESPPIPIDNGWRFEAESDGAETIRLRLELIRASCVDSVSGSLYTWTASLDVGGVVRTGCAWEGDLALDRGTGSTNLRIAS